MTRRIGVLIVLVASLVAVGAPAEAVTVSRLNSEPTPVLPGGFKVAKVTCPAGTVVISGGASMAGAHEGAVLLSSVPFDGKDADHKPDDGWKSVGFNGAVVPHDITSFAICSSDASVRYVKKSFNQLANDAARDAVGCLSSEQVIGGGAGYKEKGKTLRMVGSFPVDDNEIDANPDADDVDATADDGWRGSFKNSSSKRQKVSIWAICATGETLVYLASATVLASGTSSDVSSSCGPSAEVVGGGSEMSAVENLVLAESVTWDDPAGDVDTDRDDGWFAAAYNGGGSSEAVSVISICQSSV